MISKAILLKLLVVIGVWAGMLSPQSVVTMASARQHNEKFVSVGAAKAAGYGLLKDAKGIECIDDAMGGMGVHYVNAKYVGDAVVDPMKPEALVYEPGAGGRLHLVAAEYVVFQSAWQAKHSGTPTLYGRKLTLVPAGNRYGLPAFYEIHVWMWKHNPSSLFSDWNPKVSCAHSTEQYS
jgi:hypothetical protein